MKALIDNVCVYNMENAIRGMRNPIDSWDKSDSKFGIASLKEFEEKILPNFVKDIVDAEEDKEKKEAKAEYFPGFYNGEGKINVDGKYLTYALIGLKDLDLAGKLIDGGSEHRKFLRQIFVSMDIMMPLFWWKEMDTYKVGTVANSCSTMHTLSKNPLTGANFSFDPAPTGEVLQMREDIIKKCEELRLKYLETKDKMYWKSLVELLPSAFLQERTWTGNYEVLRTICHQRKGHKLREWEYFIKCVGCLPYAHNFILED